MPEIRIGVSPVPPHRRRYFETFSFGEIAQTWADPVRPSRLRSLRRTAGPEFEFVFAAWRWLTLDPLDTRGPTPLGLPRRELGLLQPTDANRTLWGLVAQQQRALGAHGVLLKTPSSFGPSQHNRAQMVRFLDEIVRAGGASAPKVIWEPRGIWEYDDALEFAQSCGVLLATDPFADAAFPDPLPADAYYMLTGPQGQARFRDDDLHRLVEFCDEHDGTVTLAVHGADRERIAQRILRLLQTDTGLDDGDERAVDDEPTAVAPGDDEAVWAELDDDSAWDETGVELDDPLGDGDDDFDDEDDEDEDDDEDGGDDREGGAGEPRRRR